MDENFFVGRLLESENLTDNLDDVDANKLIDWAIQQVRGIITNPLTAGERVNGLMALLRKVNNLIPDLNIKSPQELSAELLDIARTVETALERLPAIGAADLQNLVDRLRPAGPSEAIQILLEWITKE
jgi:hypothetical protein